MGATFEATVELHGKTATFIHVPAEVVGKLSDRKRVPVKVAIGKHSYLSTIAPMGGEYLLPLNRGNREAAGVAAGEQVKVTLERDDESREVEVPPQLEKALRRDRTAREAFEGMSYTHRREYAEWIAEAKKDETRRRRVRKAIELLREGRPVR